MNSTAPIGNPYFDLMADHLTGAAVDLFSACEMCIEPTVPGSESGPVSQELSTMASIGYVGDGVRGLLVLAASHAAARAWTRAAGIVDCCDFADTVGEFANMLLGHLKARLLREGIPISLATPITVSGAGLRFSVPPGHSCWQFFDGPDWRIGARLDASFESRFHAYEVDAAQQPACPGDAILF